MKKYLFGLSSVVAFALAACSVGDTDEGTLEVSNYENLPQCSQAIGASGVNYLNEKMYVEEEDAYYFCSDSGWVLVTWDLKDTAAPEIPRLYVENATVLGKALFGGAVLRGASVTLTELKLDSLKGTLTPTELSFESEVSADAGNFVVPKVSTYSQFAVLEVKGGFMDFRTGEASSEDVSLKALVDFESDGEIRVDAVSTLEFGRLEKLLKSGYTVDAARAQIKNEIWSAVGFTNVEDVDAAMMAVLVLLRGDGDDGDLVDAFNAFTEDFAEDGTWDDEDAKNAMADFAFNLENGKFINEDNGEIEFKLGDYRANMEKLGVLDFGSFESFVNSFWTANYGLGGCGAARNSVVVKNQNEGSDSASAYFMCENSAWRVATEFDRDTVGLGSAEDGAMKVGNVNKTKQFIFDTTGAGVGHMLRWRELDVTNPSDSMTMVFKESCTDDEDGTKGEFKKLTKNYESHYWGCNERRWVEISQEVYSIGYFCTKESKWENEVLVDAKTKDSTFYRCEEMAENVWMWSKKVDGSDYYTRNEESCKEGVLVSIKKFGDFVCSDAEKNEFRKATPSEVEVGKVCTDSNVGESVDAGTKTYVCGCAGHDKPGDAGMGFCVFSGFDTSSWTEKL